MRTVAALIAGLILFPALAYSQNNKDVPAAVTEAFETTYPDVRFVRWKSEGAVFKAEYRERGMRRVIEMDSAGTVVAMTSQVRTSELPSDVGNWVKENYPEYFIETVDIVEKAGERFYKVEIERTMKEIDIAFDMEGKIIPESLPKDE